MRVRKCVFLFTSAFLCLGVVAAAGCDADSPPRFFAIHPSDEDMPPLCSTAQVPCETNDQCCSHECSLVCVGDGDAGVDGAKTDSSDEASPADGGSPRDSGAEAG